MDTARATATRNMRIVGGTLVAAAVLTFGITFAVTREDAARALGAAEEQTYVEGRCVVQNVDVRERRVNDDTRWTIVTVTFTVRAPSGDVRGVDYTYPDDWWNPRSVDVARAGPLAIGAELPCFHDAREPAHAVLVRRAPRDGRDDGGSPWLVAALVGAPLLIFGLLALVVKPDPRKRPVD